MNTNPPFERTRERRDETLGGSGFKSDRVDVTRAEKRWRGKRLLLLGVFLSFFRDKKESPAVLCNW